MASTRAAQIAIVASPEKAAEWAAKLDQAKPLEAEEVLKLLSRGQIKAVVISSLHSKGLNEVLGQSQSHEDVQFIVVKLDGSPPNKLKANVWILSEEDMLETLADADVGSVRNLPVSEPPEISQEDTAVSTISPGKPLFQTPDLPDYEFPCSAPLGGGGAGKVWVAKHRKLRRLVALKIVEENACILEQHGVRIYYALMSRYPDKLLPIIDPPKNLPGGRTGFYYATELADCLVQDRFPDPEIYRPHTLQEEVRANSHSAQDAVRITIDLLSQVQLLHLAGLIHGDIKLGNVVFYKRQPRLVDLTTLRPFSPPNKRHKHRVGTKGFIPKGKMGDASWDLYGIGKVLYLLLIRKTDRMVPEDLTQAHLEALIKHHEAQEYKFIYALAKIIAGACGVEFKTESGDDELRAYERAKDMIHDLQNALALRG